MANAGPPADPEREALSFEDALDRLEAVVDPLERGELASRALDRGPPPAPAAPVKLHAAMRHLIFPGGKRLRPALAFAGAEAVGAPPERALALAAAVALVPPYSLGPRA